MTTIVTLQSSDLITNSRADINTNFSNLNTDKIETSYIDTDTTLAANSDTKIASQKATKAYVNSIQGAVTVETTTGTTHSLTTTAGQKVVVWAKGTVDTPGGDIATNYTTSLKYNGVTKDTVLQNSGSQKKGAFALMYTETPGAGTQNITVTTDASSLTQVIIIIMKIG